jgi:predicted flap endonuclease-1-like 5' DNA nuclease
MGYLQESLSTWAEFGQRTQKALMSRAGQFPDPLAKDSAPDEEPVTGEILRNLSDMNLRHWENTARLLESLPSWMTEPVINRGASLTDFFDRWQRRDTATPSRPSAPPEAPAAAAPAEELSVPICLDSPKGAPDMLTQIKGIGPKLSERLNELGIFHFEQIAGWTEAQAEWIEDQLAFKGKVRREDWIGQARQLAG